MLEGFMKLQLALESVASCAIEGDPWAVKVQQLLDDGKSDQAWLEIFEAGLLDDPDNSAETRKGVV